MADEEVTPHDWHIEAHVCLNCFGRVVSRKPSGKPRIFRCTNCGLTRAGYSRTGGLAHPSICACGARVAGRDAGMRCVVNESPSPECPSEIVAREMSEVCG